jgi:type I restriction enzyme S subunit
VTELPPGWANARLGEIGDYLNGRGFKKSEWREAGRPIIRIQNLTGTANYFNYFDGEPEEHYTARAGDLLVSWAATLGVFVWKGPEAVVNQHIFKVRSHVDRDFHRYVLLSVLDDLRRQTHGSGMVHITKGRFEATPIAVPPLSEQRRIVTALDEYFSRLDAAVQSLRQASRRLDRRRDAVLQSLIDEPGWPTSAIADVAELVTDGDHNPPPRVPTGIPHLTAKNIKRGQIVLGGCSFVSPEGFEQTRARYEPREGDVIVTCVGTIGQMAVVPPGLQFSADRNLAAIRLRADVDPSYVQLALSSPGQQRAIFSASGSTAQPHLYLRDLRALRIPLPQPSEQQHIASEVERQLSIMDAMEVEVSTARRRSAALRRSILEQAFTGKLVPQDPSDEPASVLLERIAEERAVAPKRSRRKKKVSA